MSSTTQEHHRIRGRKQVIHSTKSNQHRSTVNWVSLISFPVASSNRHLWPWIIAFSSSLKLKNLVVRVYPQESILFTKALILLYLFSPDRNYECALFWDQLSWTQCLIGSLMVRFRIWLGSEAPIRLDVVSMSTALYLKTLVPNILGGRAD